MRCARTSSSTPHSVPDALIGLDVGTSDMRDRIEPEWDYEEHYDRFRPLYPTLKELR